MTFQPNFGVFCAEILTQIIVLDVKKNRYLTLEGDSALVWKRIVGTLSKADRKKIRRLELSSIKSTLRKLKNDGLIRCGTQKIEKIDNVESNKSPLIKFVQNTEIEKSQKIKSFLALLFSYVSTKLILRFDSADDALRRLSAASLRSEVNPTEREGILGATVWAYRILFGLFTSSGTECYERSYLLCFALKVQCVRVDLVIGVDAFPFRAHAWVADNDIVLNDDFNNVSQFQPIAVFP